MSEAEKQICVSCRTIRRPVFVEPVSRSYELRTLICPQCKPELKFVCERSVRRYWQTVG
jgi:hypothetical protein